VKLLLDSCTFLWSLGLTLVTPDPEIARYPVRTLW
jgi:hypothetical protein